MFFSHTCAWVWRASERGFWTSTLVTLVISHSAWVWRASERAGILDEYVSYPGYFSFSVGVASERTGIVDEYLTALCYFLMLESWQYKRSACSDPARVGCDVAGWFSKVFGRTTAAPMIDEGTCS